MLSTALFFMLSSDSLDSMIEILLLNLFLIALKSTASMSLANRKSLCLGVLYSLSLKIENVN